MTSYIFAVGACNTNMYIGEYVPKARFCYYITITYNENAQTNAVYNMMNDRGRTTTRPTLSASRGKSSIARIH